MIRTMVIEDYDQIFSLWSGTAGMGLRSLDDSKEGIEKFILRNPSTSFVCEQNGKIIGTVLCGHDGRRGFIYHTAVAETNRRQGIGKRLISAAREALQKEGIHKVSLVVFAANQTGIAFWKAEGWNKRDDLHYYDLALNSGNR